MQTVLIGGMPKILCSVPSMARVPLVRHLCPSVTRRLTAMRFQEILADPVHPAMLPFYPDDNGYFMDNNTNVHRPRSAPDCFDGHQLDFQHLPWPLNSPYLNSIENGRDMLERHNRRHSPLPSNLQAI
ncbi:hypothetical protein TNCV_3693331 [Trichonephila clavipes]|nr:hypothetical protein TNCV_3693331 [Trichonephila clavipes]